MPVNANVRAPAIAKAKEEKSSPFNRAEAATHEAAWTKRFELKSWSHRSAQNRKMLLKTLGLRLEFTFSSSPGQETHSRDANVRANVRSHTVARLKWLMPFTG